RHLHTVHELLSVVAQPTEEMRTLRLLLTQQECFPSRRTWERRLKALPATLPAQIGCLGRHLVSLIQPWATSGRAVAIDSTVLQARGGVWHQKHREKGEVRRLFHKLRSIAIENFNEHFKGIFDAQGQVPTKGLVATQRFDLGRSLSINWPYCIALSTTWNSVSCSK